MKLKKLVLSASVAGIILAAGATTLSLQANDSAQSTSAQASDSAGLDITVYKSPNCACCQSWAEHLEASGFEVNIVETNTLNQIKQQHDVPREMASCHTALVGDLVIEGHVPATDILAYLENPRFNTVGLSVPGMVQGSPGMETGKKEDYQVIAFNANGQQSVFREHKDY